MYVLIWEDFLQHYEVYEQLFCMFGFCFLAAETLQDKRTQILKDVPHQLFNEVVGLDSFTVTH